jgi:hypothetical protein
MRGKIRGRATATNKIEMGVLVGRFSSTIFYGETYLQYPLIYQIILCGVHESDVNVPSWELYLLKLENISELG